MKEERIKEPKEKPETEFVCSCGAKVVTNSYRSELRSVEGRNVYYLVTEEKCKKCGE